jgi:hypothetical protein
LKLVPTPEKALLDMMFPPCLLYVRLTLKLAANNGLPFASDPNWKGPLAFQMTK